MSGLRGAVRNGKVKLTVTVRRLDRMNRKFSSHLFVADVTWSKLPWESSTKIIQKRINEKYPNMRVHVLDYKLSSSFNYRLTKVNQ